MAPSAFQLIRDGEPASARLRGGAVAIGNFDGVHLGHRALLRMAAERAHADGAAALALTFEPHPRTFFRPEQPVFRLTPADMKAEIIASLGFEALVVMEFDEDLARQPAEAFVEEVLVERLAARHVVTGADFHFGHKRQGTPQFLAREGKRHGFDVIGIDPVRDAGGEIVSSTRIRDCLAAGDIAAANTLLGAPWRVAADVERGRQVGRTIGYPTANLALPPETGLGFGIYAVRAMVDGTGFMDAVASFGRRPTFDNGEALLEVFVFDFDGDLYGRRMVVEFHGYLRGEEKFDGVEALVAQMDRDSEQARAILAKLAR